MGYCTGFWLLWLWTTVYSTFIWCEHVLYIAYINFSLMDFLDEYWLGSTHNDEILDAELCCELIDWSWGYVHVVLMDYCGPCCPYAWSSHFIHKERFVHTLYFKWSHLGKIYLCTVRMRSNLYKRERISKKRGRTMNECLKQLVDCL